MQWIGRGRSANVYVERDEDGLRVAHKVFTPDSLSRFVFYALDGAPNPYGWNEHAIAAALARRQILGHLVEFWFGARLSLPVTYGTAWNEQARAYELRCEFIDGRHLALRGPDGSEDRLEDLTAGIMTPLQRHLEQAGFDGMVWQAGRGNPVAASNFMLRDGDDPAHWVWIDLESGVPALFSCSPRAQLRFYVPRCWHYRRLLFDDTNTHHLRSYLEERREDLENELGRKHVEEVFAAVEELDHRQVLWKSLARHERGILSHRTQGRLTEAEALWYIEHRARWTAHLIRVGGTATAVRLGTTLHGAWQRLRRLDVQRALASGWSFMTSQSYRTELSRGYVSRRIAAWEARGFLEPPLVEQLHGELGRDASSAYIADFGVHLMLKPFVKVLQWWVVPALFLFGTLDEWTVALVLVSGGAVARTAYTLGRLVQSALSGERLPVIALGIGALPVAGNTAFPAELVACSRGDARILARFIVYDAFAAIWRAVPIWGGPDTLTEHRLNRLPDVVANSIRSLLGSRQRSR